MGMQSKGKQNLPIVTKNSERADSQNSNIELSTTSKDPMRQLNFFHKPPVMPDKKPLPKK